MQSKFCKSSSDVTEAHEIPWISISQASPTSQRPMHLHSRLLQPAGHSEHRHKQGAAVQHVEVPNIWTINHANIHINYANAFNVYSNLPTKLWQSNSHQLCVPALDRFLARVCHLDLPKIQLHLGGLIFSCGKTPWQERPLATATKAWYFFSLHSFSGRLIHNWSPLAKNSVLGTSRGARAKSLWVWMNLHDLHEEKNLNGSKSSSSNVGSGLWMHNAAATSHPLRIARFQNTHIPCSFKHTRQKNGLKKNRTNHHTIRKSQGKQQHLLKWVFTTFASQLRFVKDGGPKKSSWLRSPGESGSK